MRKIALFLFAVIVAASAFAQSTSTTPTAYAEIINQRNAANNAQTTYYVTPSRTGDEIFMYSVADDYPEYTQLGPGLSRSSKTLNIAPASTQISDSTIIGRALLTAANSAAARTAIGAGQSDFSGIYGDLASIPSTFPPSAHTQAFSTITSTPTSCAGYGIADCLTTTAAASTYATQSSVTSGLAGKQNSLTLTTTGTGAASLVGATLNIPTPASASPFNFSQPSGRSLSVSTSYQGADTSKAAIIYPSYACQNATTVLAASGCTVQVRMGTSALTCSTGTVYYTQSLTVQLGVLITQNSTNPVPIFLPAGAHFIICPTTGTFTVSATEQSAG